MLEFLPANLQHFSPGKGHDDTSESTNSQVEGFFDAFKNAIQHEVLLFATAIRGIRDLGQMALVNRAHAKIHGFPPDIISLRDQRRFGLFAAMIPEIEWANMQPAEMPFRECCEVA
jgi:hypothetical protein